LISISPIQDFKILNPQKDLYLISIHPVTYKPQRPARWPKMAKSHYSFKKRKKELARKLKQEEKRQRKFEKNSTKSEEILDETQDKV
jgi:hypothetical protein